MKVKRRREVLLYGKERNRRNVVAGRERERGGGERWDEMY